VDWVDGLGFVASAAVLATFCMQRMIMLRVLALVSNVLFAGYGYFGHLHPVLALHLVLFPINTFRLLQLTILVGRFGYFSVEQHRPHHAADAGLV
jgi:CRP/FNR family cyclic AMP-dependent transcriptional regulator